jgi:insertion element IS1 protein InsB
MKPYLICPSCGSDDVMKNGMTRRGKQNHKCRDCGRQFVEDPQWAPRDRDTCQLINLMLLERLSLAGIARVLSISESWLQQYVNQFYQEVPQQAQVLPKEKGQLRVQMDELWSFVDSKNNKQWVWLAIDSDTREIIACHIGNRSRQSAQALWNALPAVYRQCAQVYTDYWEAYQTVIPSKRHQAVGKESGKTSYIERLNNTLRQRIARLVRKSLSFSKKVENHIGAIWYFIGEYNRQIRLRIEADRMASRYYYPSFT